MKIYTKTGDKGETGLYGGKRILKNSLRIEAIGMVDELNSAIGIIVAQFSIFNFQFSNKSQKTNFKKELTNIQNDLYEIGALLATPQDTEVGKGKVIRQKFPVYLKARTEELEAYIDVLTAKLPPLTAFILPGGGKTGASLHYARTLCRRAERRIVDFAQKDYVCPEILEYMNRLSDVFFTMARFANYTEKKKETIWKQNG